MLLPSSDDYPELRRLERGANGFFQPDRVEEWIGPDYGRAKWEHVPVPEQAMDLQLGVLPNRGDGGAYGVTIDYVGAEFFATPAINPDPLGPLCGWMIGAMLAPHRGRVPVANEVYCACDSVGEDLTQAARVLLDQYPVEELFVGGSLLLLIETEFVATWPIGRQEQALRFVVDRLVERRKRLWRVAVQVQVPAFNREARPEDPPDLQLIYRDELAAEWARWEQIQLSSQRRAGTDRGRAADLHFSLDRRYTYAESLVELLRHSGQLPPRSSAF